MRKTQAMLFAAVLCLFSAGLLRAQYTINFTAEEAFAEAEDMALGTGPTPMMVPHLTPLNVAAAMANSQYLPGHSTPFIFVIAHRGSHSVPGCAENSACAIAAAYESGPTASNSMSKSLRMEFRCWDTM